MQLWLAWKKQEAYNIDNKRLLFILIAQQRVGKRSGRIEPRVLKRRPKAYPFLRVPRAEARERVRQNGHPKKLK